MTINIEEVLERAVEQAFLKALEQTVQVKAEESFCKALSGSSPLAERPQEKIDEGLQRFLEDGIRWDKKKPGFKK